MPGLLALIEGELPSGRYRARDARGVHGVSALAVRAAAPARGARAAGGARARAATTCACSSPTADGAIVHAPLPRPAAASSRPATSSSSTPPPRCRRPRRRPGRTAPSSSCGSRRRRAAATRRCWLVELRRGDAPFGAVGAGERFDAPRRRDGADPRALRRRPALARPARAARAARASTSPSTAGRSATATCRAAGRSSAYQNVYALEPGSAEMPSAGRPFTAELITRLVAGGVLVAPIVAAHRRLLAGAPRAPVPGALPRAASRRRGSSTPSTAGAAA